MIITKEQQEEWVAEYDAGHTVLATVGFAKGIDKALTEVAKGCIDKAVAIRFAQSLTNHEVTESDLTKFLNNQ